MSKSLGVVYGCSFSRFCLLVERNDLGQEYAVGYYNERPGLDISDIAIEAAERAFIWCIQNNSNSVAFLSGHGMSNTFRRSFTAQFKFQQEQQNIVWEDETWQVLE